MIELENQQNRIRYIVFNYFELLKKQLSYGGDCNAISQEVDTQRLGIIMQAVRWILLISIVQPNTVKFY